MRHFIKIRYQLKNILTPLNIVVFMFSGGLLHLYFFGVNFYIKAYLLIVWALFYLGSSHWFSMMLSKKFDKYLLVKNDINTNVQWIAVLGGGFIKRINENSNIMLNIYSVRRVLEGVRLYNELPNAKLIFSGGDIDHLSKESVAEKMASLAMGLGVPETSIVITSRPINTIEEARAIKEIVNNMPFYLVTSDHHMARAIYIFKKFKNIPIPAIANNTYYSIYKNINPGHLGITSWIYLKISFYEALGSLTCRLFRNV